MAPRHWFWRACDCCCRHNDFPRPVRDLSKPCPVVRGSCQTGLQSSQLGLCAGLDIPLRADGIRGMANLAATPSVVGTTFSVGPVCYSTRAECSMVVDVFWCQQSVVGRSQHHPATARHSRDYCRIPSTRQSGRLVPCATRGLGRICERSQHRNLAVEHLKRNAEKVV